MWLVVILLFSLPERQVPAGQHLHLRVNSTAQSHSLHLPAGLPARAPGSDLRWPASGWHHVQLVVVQFIPGGVRPWQHIWGAWSVTDLPQSGRSSGGARCCGLPSSMRG